MKITFKKEPMESGLRSVGYPHQNVNIKIDGRVVGYIGAPNWQTKHVWTIRLMVYKNAERTPEDNCAWKTIKVVRTFESETTAREWVINHLENISKKYDLRSEE